MAASSLRNNPAFTLTTPSDREIVMTRQFEAPRHLVFEAWTKSEHVARWWGCQGGTVPLCESDLRAGGEWRRILRTADGKDHVFKCVYHEITMPERLVYTECFDDPGLGSPQWLTTVTFDEHEGKTTMTCTMLHTSKEVRDGHLRSGMEAGVTY